MFTFAKSAVLVCFALALTSVSAHQPTMKSDDAGKRAEVSRKLLEFNKDLQALSARLEKAPELVEANRMPIVPLPKAEGASPAAPPQLTTDETLLKNANVKTDSADLLDFFHKRVLSEGDRPKIDAAIRQLGAASYQEREAAMKELIARGTTIVDMLREAMKDDDPEISRRAEKTFNRILQDDVGVEVSAAAARLLAARKPQGAVEALFAYLPSAHTMGLADDVRDALVTLAAADATVLVKGLQDSSPLRRSGAAEVLCQADFAKHKGAVRKLLQDGDPHVKLRVARCLVFQGDDCAVPVLIEVLPQITYNQAWQVDDILFRLADGKTPPMVSVGRDEATRKRCKEAWQAWYEKEGKKIDLAKLNETPPLIGHTLIVLLDENRVVDLDGANRPLWSLNNLAFPLDAQVLPGDRVLVAEHKASRVTERNFKGEILWKKDLQGAPLLAQRLSNGHTFVATNSQLMEFDREDKEVVSIAMPGELMMKALKLPNNEICCLTSPDEITGTARIVRLDANGAQLSTFSVSTAMRLSGGRLHVQSNGNVLVAHNTEGKVVEYDLRGKDVWEVRVPQPISAIRLANGNTLVTTMESGAMEFNRAGAMVWSFRAAQPGSRVTRAVRR
jgi:hypothetical protein